MTNALNSFYFENYQGIIIVFWFPAANCQERLWSHWGVGRAGDESEWEVGRCGGEAGVNDVGVSSYVGV